MTVTTADVRAAFTAVAASRYELADRLRAAGRGHEADIVAIGALIAADPALSGPARRRAGRGGAGGIRVIVRRRCGGRGGTAAGG